MIFSKTTRCIFAKGLLLSCALFFSRPSFLQAEGKSFSTQTIEKAMCIKLSARYRVELKKRSFLPL